MMPIDKQGEKIERDENRVESKNATSVSRRAVLKGAVGLGAIASSGALGFKFPTEAEAAINKPPKKWDREVDVVVIGAGGAGLAAALEAAEAGAVVIVLEKQPVYGGSTSISTGSILCTGSDLQRKAEVEDSPDALYKYFRQVNENLNDEVLVRTLVNNIGPDIDWLLRHGVEFIKGVYTVMGSPVRRALLIKGGGAGLTTPLYNSAKKSGANILTEVKAEKLFTKTDGRVIGVEAKNKRGKTINIKAKKAVILSSGGFCASPEFMKRFASAFYYFVPASAPGSTGDGTKMGMDVGSDLVNMDAILPTPTVEISTKMMITSYVLDTGAGILVNEGANRFCNETSGGYYDTALIVGEQIRKQKNKFVTEIFGRHARENVPRIKDYLGWGVVIEADTIEELASKVGLNPAALKETILKFNEAVEKKADPEFGRMSLKAKLEPKFGAMKVSSGMITSTGGLRRNAESKVLNYDGKVIPGLYAAGEVAGGLSLRGTVGGDYLGGAVVFGRIAGKNAAAEKSMA